MQEGNRSRYTIPWNSLKFGGPGPCTSTWHYKTRFPELQRSQKWNVASKSYFNGQLYKVPLFSLREGSSLQNVYTPKYQLSQKLQGNGLELWFDKPLVFGWKAWGMQAAIPILIGWLFTSVPETAEHVWGSMKRSIATLCKQKLQQSDTKMFVCYGLLSCNFVLAMLRSVVSSPSWRPTTRKGIRLQPRSGMVAPGLEFPIKVQSQKRSVQGKFLVRLAVTVGVDTQVAEWPPCRSGVPLIHLVVLQTK